MGDIESIVNSCNNLEGEIKKIQSSSCWYYNNLKNDEEKQHFLNKFIEYINK